MKKLCLVVLSLSLVVVSCSSPDQRSYREYDNNKFSNLERDPPRYSGNRRARPSELMQVGLDNRGNNSDNNGDYNRKYLLRDGLSEEETTPIDKNNQYLGQYKIGNPYQISGTTYYPQKYDNYEEVGVASWYGDDFHGKKTANGEIYKMGDMTAAHRTLPLPSIVRITNLDNGKSVKVRINDRGPFAKKRVVDVSEKAARMLGFKDKGTANIKLEYLKEDTEQLLNELKITQK